MASDPFDSSESNQNENHQPKFRGTWAPAELHDLLASETIDLAEFVLLQIIDSLVDSKGDGCWACADYLARRIKRSKVHTKRLLANLKNLGLIRIVGTKRINGRDYRILETKWSRVECTDSQVSSMIPVQSHTRYPSGIAHDTQRILIEDPNREKERTPGVRSVFSNGKLTNTNKKTDPQYKSLAARLRTILRSKKPPIAIGNGGIAGWADKFRLLVKKLEGDTDRVTILLDWYENSIHTIIEPIIVSAEHFCNAFNWLENLMRKDEERSSGERQMFTTTIKDGKKITKIIYR